MISIPSTLLITNDGNLAHELYELILKLAVEIAQEVDENPKSLPLPSVATAEGRKAKESESALRT